MFSWNQNMFTNMPTQYTDGNNSSYIYAKQLGINATKTVMIEWRKLYFNKMCKHSQGICKGKTGFLQKNKKTLFPYYL